MADDIEAQRLALKYQLRFRLIDVLAKALDQIIPGVVLVLIVYFGIYRTAHDLAGRRTLADFGFRLFADAKPDEIIAYALAIVGWFFGVNAQRLRRNTTERLTARIQELERKIDPERTTSGLTPRGKTPPEVE